MIYGFDTDDPAAATAALLVYAVYRSRDVRRYRVRPDMWGQIERFVKAAAKRAETVPAFIEALKPRLACETLQPAAMRVGLGDAPVMELRRGDLAPRPAAQREFLTRALRDVPEEKVLGWLYRQTAWVILLVRDRLERERPVADVIQGALLEGEP